MNPQEIEIKKKIAHIKKVRAEQVAKYDLEIAELDLKLISVESEEIENEKLYEQISSEFEKNGYPIIPTKFGNVIEIDKGILLSASSCKDYSNIRYEGKGVIKSSRKPMSLSAPEILTILSDYDNIPKEGIDARKKWVSKKIGKAKRIDTILWNYVNGNLTEVLQQYVNENPLFYEKGQLVLNKMEML